MLPFSDTHRPLGCTQEATDIVVHLTLSDDEAVLESGKFFNAEREVLAWDDERYLPKGD